ncbi:MAG: hypothetical protein RIG62_30885 [Cyclobacteriaceae bacterium]
MYHFKILLLPIGLLLAQTVWGQHALLTDAVQDVQVKNEIYEQSFSYDAENTCLLTFTVLDTDKGEETVYEVNAADLNEHKVRFDTQGKAVLVEAETRGSKDLVRVIEDGEIKGFDDGFEIYASGIENARNLVTALKEVVKTCNEQNKEILVAGNANPTFNEALTFLSSEIGDMKVGSKEYGQSFAFETDQSTMITYTWEDLTEGESLKYIANVADFNEQSVSFNTKGGNVWLALETQGGRDLIQTYENGELDDYESKIEIMASEIEQARVLEKALKVMVAAAAQQQEPSFLPGNASPDLGTTTRFLQEQVGTVTLSKAIYEQTFTYEATAQQIRYDVTELSKAEKHSYLFNPADINVNTIGFDTRGSEVLIQLETQADRDLIQVLENDEVDGYEDKVTLRTPGIEDARRWCSALKRLVSLARENQQDNFYQVAGENPDQSATLQFYRKMYIR